MNIGMLWFDNDAKADLSSKIKRASSYYREKYGQTPNVCFVHPSMIAKEGNAEAGIELRTTRSVLPNHFWLGISTTSSN